MKQKIVPINGKLLIEPIKKEALSKGGIYIPDSVDPNAKGMTRGRIIGIACDCDVRRWGFKIGQTVLFGKFTYEEVRLPPLEAGQEDRTLLFVEQTKISGVIEDVQEEVKP